MNIRGFLEWRDSKYACAGLVLCALVIVSACSCSAADSTGTPKPFWNKYSVQFMYAPAFDFAEIADAVRYRFVVTDDVLNDHVFESAKPTDRLSPVWDGLPVGYAKVTVYGLDAQGRVRGIAGERRFWRSAPFVPDVPWSYGEAATRYYAWLFEQPNTVSFREKGVPNGGELDLLEIYPSKMNSCLITAMLHYAKGVPDRFSNVAVATSAQFVSAAANREAMSIEHMRE